MPHPGIYFGTAGVPHSTEKYSSAAGIARISALGLEAMELQFVQRVSMGEESAHQVRQAALDHGVRLSAHAPYYINFNSQAAEKVEASGERLLKAARIAALCGAHSVVFHAGYYHDDPPAVVYGRIKERLQALTEQVRAEGLSICLRPETSGRASQFGDLDEVLRLSAEIAGVRPCIDWGHLYARACGVLNGYSAFGTVLDRVQAFLGKGALSDMHLHVQGMAYTRAGERKHLNLGASDLRYEELAQALLDWGVGGTVVCESPNLEEDALLLKQVYRRLRTCVQAGHS